MLQLLVQVWGVTGHKSTSECFMTHNLIWTSSCELASALCLPLCKIHPSYHPSCTNHFGTRHLLYMDAEAARKHTSTTRLVCKPHITNSDCIAQVSLGGASSCKLSWTLCQSWCPTWGLVQKMHTMLQWASPPLTWSARVLP